MGNAILLDKHDLKNTVPECGLNVFDTVWVVVVQIGLPPLLVQIFEIRVFPKPKKTEIRLSGRFRLPRGEAFFVVFNPSFRDANSAAEFLAILCTCI